MDKKNEPKFLKKYSKEELLKLINQHLFVIANFVDKNEPQTSSGPAKIEIHINSNKKDAKIIFDSARMSFVLYSISRLYKKENLELEVYELNKIINKSEVKCIYDNILRYTLDNLEEIDKLYVLMYGMRAHVNLGFDYTDLVKEFVKLSPAQIYTYPVTSYVYMSAYLECETLRNNYKFAKDIYNNCLKAFDYILYSDIKDKYLPFHFAELSHHSNYDSTNNYLSKYASEYINGSLEKYLQSEVSASGVAKCAEHYARVNDYERLDMCFKFLNSRKLSRYTEYISPRFEGISEYMYTEGSHTHYICLDTNAHLLNAYINLCKNT